MGEFFGWICGVLCLGFVAWLVYLAWGIFGPD